MKKFFTTYFVLLIFLNTLMAQDVRIMESLSFFSKILGQEVKYSIYLPQDYFREKNSYPVVYLLHGLGDDETSWLEYGQISQIVDKAVQEKAVIPMIFVMPQGFRSYYMNDFAGTFRYQDMFIQELIPLIDNQYRTIADREHRATMGYSMGGFGALILPLKNPEVFGTTVPLSISIRTDQQYMKEDSAGWNQQWGRIFGGMGTSGNDRITDYYRQNNPFRIFSQNDLLKLSGLKIYIANGDEEQTLCRSNEELHILLRNKNYSHEFRVLKGGHEFSFWRSCLPNALNFISDAFDLKPYRGDIRLNTVETNLPEKQMLKLNVRNEMVQAFMPADYETSSRLYPVLYLAGNFTEAQQNRVAKLINQKIESDEICPMLVVFLTAKSFDQFTQELPELEVKLRIRKGYRFRALAGYQETALRTFATVLNQEQFSSCIMADGFLAHDSILNLISEIKPKALEHTAIFIDAPDKSKYYEGNGNTHILLRDKDIRHQYRVREGAGGFDWFLAGLPEICVFVSNKFHQ